MRLEIGLGFGRFVDTTGDGGDGDDEDVWYWLCKSDVGASICENGELVFQLFSLTILSKKVSFELNEYCSSPDSLST